MSNIFQKAADRLISLMGPRFECPICQYRGTFRTERPPTGVRVHARCPSCGALERHRLQFLVLQEILEERDPGEMAVLHVAPDGFLVDWFRATFGHYMTAGFGSKDVDIAVDLTRIPFDDASFDMVFAAHSLEHIPNDRRAMAEVARILKPGGIAILPIPVIGIKTIEHPATQSQDTGHVRSPGRDYFFRFRDYFAVVRLFASDYFPEKYQVFCYEDRSRWPASMSDRPKEKGKKHQEIVPVCFK